MMRPVLAVMAGLLCGVMGLRQASRIRETNATLHRWHTLLQHLCLLLQEQSLSLPEAFTQAAAENTAADQLLRQWAEALRRDPLTPLPQHYAPQGAEGAVLLRLLDGLSHGSLESRVLSAQQAAEEMALLASAAQSKAQQDSKMWSTLGWTCGACLTLMLL
ncbi:MAG: hypothetical protein IJX84_03975 [Clostridia bacterium]|nr:hypothetical protein [Clostridia bacterium]